MAKWNDNDPEWRLEYDRTMSRIRTVLGSYNRIAGELYRESGHPITGAGVRRWVLEGTVPLPWACTFIDVMAEKGEDLTLLDFYPWLGDYLDSADFLR